MQNTTADDIFRPIVIAQLSSYLLDAQIAMLSQLPIIKKIFGEIPFRTEGRLGDLCSEVHSTYLLAAKRQLVASAQAGLAGVGKLAVTYNNGEPQFAFAEDPLPDSYSERTTLWTPLLEEMDVDVYRTDIESLIASSVHHSQPFKVLERVREEYRKTLENDPRAYLTEKAPHLAEQIQRELVESNELLLHFLRSQRRTLYFFNFGRFQHGGEKYVFQADIDLCDYLHAAETLKTLEM